jgi:hypothetical protein
MEIVPDVPPVLSDVIHRCLRKDPAERFQTSAELRDGFLRLRQLSDSGSLYAQPPLPETVMVPAKVPVSSVAVAPPPSKLLTYTAGVFAVLGLAAAAWFILPHKYSDARQTPAVVSPEGGSSAKPSPTVAEPPAPPPVPAAKEEALLLVAVPDGTRVPLALETDIPIEAEPGLALRFRVTEAVVIDGETVIAKGAAATGEFYSREKKKQFLVVGRGSKTMVQMHTVEAPDGAKLQLNVEPRSIETPGLKSKTIAVAKGSVTVAQTDGRQAIRVKR